MTAEDRPAYMTSHTEAIVEIGYLGALLALAIEDNELSPGRRALALERESVRGALRPRAGGSPGADVRRGDQS